MPQTMRAPQSTVWSPWPIIVKSFRERCRPLVLVSWSMVVLTVTSMICLGTYLGEIERLGTTPAEAARAMVVPVIIIQAVILMFLGTGAVANGIASERQSGVIDYQRMTPMSTPAKLLGYLFGLPAREYLLFALTIPFIVFCVIRGELQWIVVAHFYLIFAMSVIVYHITGMAAGMISTKARWTAYIAQVMVLVLYFVLPNFSRFGLTFFEFLTIRPALFGLVVDELNRLNGGESITIPESLTALDSFRNIPFYETTLHPTVYTFLVQGGLVATLWHLISRRWRADDIPGFSKIGGTVFLLGATFLALGGAWAAFTGPHGILRIYESFAGKSSSDDIANVGVALSMLYTLMILVIGIFTVANCSPSVFLTGKGYQRMRKRGERSLGWFQDASSSLPIGILAGFLTVMSACMLYGLLCRQGIVLGWPTIANGAVYLGVLFAVALFAQGIAERCTTRMRFVVVFVLWIVPLMAIGVLAAADADELLASFVSLPCPPAAAFFALDQATSTVAVPEGVHALGWARRSAELGPEVPALAIVGCGVHVALATVAQVLNIRTRRAKRHIALHPEGPRASAQAIPPIPGHLMAGSAAS